MAASPVSLTALLHGPDRPGLVAGVSGWIFERGGNILHADQHNDPHHGIFFQRVEWRPALTATPAAEAADFTAFAASLGMTAQVALSTRRPKVVIMVSQHVHACHELLLDISCGDLPCEVVGVISNHEVMRPAVEAAGFTFHQMTVTAENKAAVETRQLEILAASGAELVILARYMQVLSGDFLAKFARPVINIHHSFLPAFAGANPYRQAHLRGVKLIGATAHYVTPVLDAGPIIHQEVRRVSHRDAVPDLMRKGRDLEKIVLSEAVRLHLESRVLVFENKTVVFD